MQLASSFLLLLLTLGSVSSFAPNQPYHVRSKSAISVLPDSLDLPQSAAGTATAVAKSAAAVDAITNASSSGSPSMAILAAGAVGIAAIAALAFSTMGGAVADAPSASSNSKQNAPAVDEPEPVDLSIPYDAAAVLTYLQYKGLSEIDDQADYQAFKTAYEEATVADVTLKKMKRQVAEMESTVASKKSALDAFKVELSP